MVRTVAFQAINRSSILRSATNKKLSPLRWKFFVVVGLWGKRSLIEVLNLP